MSIVSPNEIYGLYCRCHPDRGVRYVGQTRRGARGRFNQHRNTAMRGKVLPVYDWMRKHGVENISFRVLESLSNPADLNRREVYWVDHLNTFSKGLNMSRGGDQSGYRMPREIADRLAESRRGRQIHTKEHRLKLSLEVSGELNPSAKLTWEDIKDIRRRYVALEKPGVLLREYGITDAMLSRIILNRNWVDPEWTVPDTKAIRRARSTGKLEGDVYPKGSQHGS